MKKVGIFGYGEIGKAISKFYEKPFIKDLDKDTFPEQLDVLHVCIPYFKKFKKVVKEIIEKYNPSIVIIHSTVKPGTTEYFYSLKRVVVHSPVRGVHPKLYEGIKTFVKYIGANNIKDGKIVQKHFRSIGIKSRIISSSYATELGKLLDTTYYGLCIEFHRYGKDLCNKARVNFEEVMTDFNKTYNEGYKKLGKGNVIRPVLYPPQGKIGGHCVLPNAQILKGEFGNHEILKSILK